MSNSASFFLVYPRTRQRIAEFETTVEKLYLLEPLPYIEFLALQHRAAVVITDSSGIQEETTYLGVPCLTMRDNTARPVTVTSGINVLVGQDRKELLSDLTRILEGNAKTGTIPPLWDGRGGSNRRRPVSRSIRLKWKTCSLPGEYRWIRWMGLPGCSSSVFLPDPQTGR